MNETPFEIAYRKLLKAIDKVDDPVRMELVEAAMELVDAHAGRPETPLLSAARGVRKLIYYINSKIEKIGVERGDRNGR